MREGRGGAKRGEGRRGRKKSKQEREGERERHVEWRGKERKGNQ